MNLKKCLLTNNNCYKAAQIITPKGIMWHSTGANNPNLRRYVQPNDGPLGVNINGNHWNTPKPDGYSVCVHAFIGKLADGTVATYQTLPWNYNGWHCGGSANNSHIGFEICEGDLNDRTYFEAVYREAVEFSAYLCKLYGLNPLAGNTIIDHSTGYKLGMASNHGDVMHWFSRYGVTLAKIRQDIYNKMTEDEIDMTKAEVQAMIKTEAKAIAKSEIDTYLAGQDNMKPSEWSEEAREFCENNGIFQGGTDKKMRYRSYITREEAAAVMYRLYNVIMTAVKKLLGK